MATPRYPSAQVCQRPPEVIDAFVDMPDAQIGIADLLFPIGQGKFIADVHFLFIQFEGFAQEMDDLLVCAQPCGLLARLSEVFDGLLGVLGHPPVMHEQRVVG
jgi:hypothetical protein